MLAGVVFQWNMRQLGFQAKIVLLSCPVQIAEVPEKVHVVAGADNYVVATKE